jgi:RimJ/RimL family protein N-acetyltransferase
VADDGRVTHRYWPLLDLRLRTPDLELRVMTEADLAQLAEQLPHDVELDPAATTYPGLDEATNRGVVVHQTYWRHFGSWSPQAWRLNFVVYAGGELIGVQELEGNDFPALRTVDSSSHLIASARGRGLGQQMRRAVLALAFGPLEAEAAITSAWQDNAASLGVSRALGYAGNGVELHRRGDGVDTMVHLRLTRATWLATSSAETVTITNVQPCLPLFAL